MKVLWLVNVKLPEISKIQGQENVTYTGGWLSGLYNCLIQHEQIDKLMICYPTKRKKEHGGELKTVFVSFNESNLNTLKNYFIDILNEFQPDIVHIHGTEFEYSYIMSKAVKECGISNKTVCSIQGLVSVYSEHFFGGIEEHIYKKRTISEYLSKNSLMDQKKSYQKRGELEIELIKSIPNIIGRTSWDKACVTLINPNVRYFHCNEILRQNFYTGTWDYDKCKKHSVMLSQGTKPIKGLHMAIKALGIVNQFYPDVTAYVAGENIFDKSSPRYGGTYARYIRNLVNENNLSDKIIFTGVLQVNEMKKMMLNSNVFLLASSIENSPNSLGEAMIMGVPCIASDVGGVMDMMAPFEEGYIYPFNEYYKMAYYIMDVFSKGENISEMTNKASKKAKSTHDPDNNTKEMLTIYNKITQGVW